MRAQTEYFTFHTEKRRKLVHLTARRGLVTEGRLDLATWQRVFYAEPGSQRDERLIVKRMGIG